MWIIRVGLFKHDLMETRAVWIFTTNQYAHLDFKTSYHITTLGL